MADKREKSGGPASASSGEQKRRLHVSKSTSKPARQQPSATAVIAQPNVRIESRLQSPASRSTKPSVRRATGGEALPSRGQRQRPPGSAGTTLDVRPATRTENRLQNPASSSARPNTVCPAPGKETSTLRGETPQRLTSRYRTQIEPAETAARPLSTGPSSRSQAAARPVTGSFTGPETTSGTSAASSSRPEHSQDPLRVLADMAIKQAKIESPSRSHSATETATDLYCDEHLDAEPSTVPPPDEESSNELSSNSIGEDARRRGSTSLPPGRRLEMKICIETDFLLAARNAHHEASTPHGFVSALVRNHNLYSGGSFPSISDNLRDALEDDDYGRFAHGEWSITNRQNIAGEQPSCKLFSF